MTHDEASQALAAAALDALPADEQAAVVAHAEGCATCGPEFAELRAAMANLSFAAPALDAGADVDARLAGVRGRLLSRVRGEEGAASIVGAASSLGAASSVGAASSERPPDETSRANMWLLLALAASFFVATVLWRHDMQLGRQLAEARAAAASSHTALDSATTALAATERQLALTTGPTVDVISLTASGAPSASALMFWDRTSNTWSMYARHLPQLAAGRTYELWLITKAGKKIPAGTFQPSPVGTAHVETTFDLGHAPLAVVAVTEEPAGGVESPTGPIVIAGSPLTLK